MAASPKIWEASPDGSDCGRVRRRRAVTTGTQTNFEAVGTKSTTDGLSAHTTGVVKMCTDSLERVERILRQTVRKSHSVRSVEHEDILKESRRVRLSSRKGPLPGE